MYASERSERARKFSYLYSFTNAISMQLLTKLQIIITSGTTKERGALLSEIIIVLDKKRKGAKSGRNVPFVP